MRTDITAPELALLAAGEYDEHWRVKVANGSGTMVDVSSRLKSGTIRLPSPDTPIGTAEITLWRDINDDATASLAPLVDASTYNRLDDGITISPLFQIGRAATIEVAVTARGAARPAGASTLWHEVIGGFAKQPSWPQRYGDVTLEVYDRAYKLMRTFVESPQTYVATTTVEAAMQALLNDTMGAGAYTLVVDDVANSPAGTTGSALSVDYQPEIKPVWTALQDLASSIGWVLWYRYSAAGAPQLTLTEPRRAKVSADYTFAAAQIKDVTRLTIVEEDIRNVVVVKYLDSDGAQQSVTSEDATSIAKYGAIRRYVLIVEDDTSPIRTQAAAEALRDAVLSDLKDPDADQAIETLGAWWLGEAAVDLYAFPANTYLYDNAQTLAPYAIEVAFSQGDMARSTIAARGKPSGGSGTWMGRDGSNPTGAAGGKMWADVSVANESMDLYARVYGAARNYPATLNIYQDTPTGTPIATHEFSVPDTQIGPGDYAALNDIPLPKAAALRFWGELIDSKGVVAWLFTMADLDNLPGGSVTASDFTAQPTFTCRYDDDVVRIVVTTPSGPKTFSGLSGGGTATYQVGVTALDSTSTETDLSGKETRAGYVVTYYGAASGGPAFVAWDGPLHGEEVGAPGLVIESEAELVLSGEVVTATEDAYIGSVASFTNDTWANLQGGLNTSLNFSRTDTFLECWLSRDSSGSASEWARIYRSMIAFPTTSIDAGAIATEDSFVRLHVVLAPQETIAGQKVVLTKASPVSASTMAHSDWSLINGAFEYSLPVTITSLTNGADISFTLTAAGAEALTDAIAAQVPFVVGVQIESDAENAEPTITAPTTELNARTRFASVNHGTAAYRPVISISANLPAARVILRHSDPGVMTTTIQYRSKAGSADWPASWSTLVDNSGGPVPTGVLTSYPIDVTTYESPQSWVQARLIYAAGGDTVYSSPITSSGFDSGKLPNVVATAVADVNWNVAPDTSGDLDTKSQKTAFAVGVNPTKPTRSDVRLRTAVDGRKLTPDDWGYAYTDVPVVLAPGERVIFGTLGFTAVSGGGRESTEVEYCEATRPFDLASGDPQLGALTVSAADDTSGNVVCTVNWPDAANLVDGTHYVYVNITWPPATGVENNDTEAAPDTNKTVDVTFSGYGASGAHDGDIAASDRWKATAELRLDSDDSVIDTAVQWGYGFTV